MKKILYLGLYLIAASTVLAGNLQFTESNLLYKQSYGKGFGVCGTIGRDMRIKNLFWENGIEASFNHWVTKPDSEISGYLFSIPVGLRYYLRPLPNKTRIYIAGDVCAGWLFNISQTNESDIVMYQPLGMLLYAGFEQYITKNQNVSFKIGYGYNKGDHLRNNAENVLLLSAGITVWEFYSPFYGREKNEKSN